MRRCHLWSRLSPASSSPLQTDRRKKKNLAAARAEQELAKPGVHKRLSAYQLFISERYGSALAQHPHLSLGELTAQHLAPAWHALSASERKIYEQRAVADAVRWEREKEEAKSKATNIVFERVKQISETLTSAPLSGQGLFLAANWDTSEADPALVWTELNEEAQKPWKEKALKNQKQFALDALKPKRIPNANAGKNKRKKIKTAAKEAAVEE